MRLSRSEESWRRNDYAACVSRAKEARKAITITNVECCTFPRLFLAPSVCVCVCADCPAAAAASAADALPCQRRFGIIGVIYKEVILKKENSGEMRLERRRHILIWSDSVVKA